MNATISTIISLTALFIMLLLIIYTNKTLDYQDHISSILRSYVTKMEIAGCLNQDDVENLIEDLKEFGMTEVYLYGNFAGGVSAAVVENYGPAVYGDQVQLRVKGKLLVKSLNEDSGGVLNLVVGTQELEVDLKQKGISVR